jgi:uncharacterized protein
MSAPANDPAIDSSRHGYGLLALLLLVPVPTLGVLAAMWWEPTRGTPLGQGLYAAAKAWILLLPAIWTLAVDRDRIRFPLPAPGGMRAGIASGLLIAAAIFGGHWFIGRQVIDVESQRAALAANGLDQPWRYLALVITLTLVNSLLEEYVWRWFAYRQCERFMPAWFAVIASASMFTLHHLFALRSQMDWTPTLLACAGIFIGGCTWSWLYRRYRSIWPGYVSHILADAAVFSVGWMLLFT